MSAGLLLAAQFSGLAANEFWQRQNIYQIITDRFFDGDPTNNNADGNYDPSGRRGTSVHGGDFKGIEQKLDYIQALGVTAIWISPIVANARGEFHGYAARDFYKVDPHWGAMSDLQHLVKLAHARGILVIDDIVVNHGGNLIDSSDSGYGKFKPPPDGYVLRLRDPARQYAPPFDLNPTNPALSTLFHNNGLIRDYSDAAQVELGELSGLDDFKTETRYVRDRMAEIYQFWIAQAGFDGFRVDTVKHVDMGFWQSWCPAIHRYAAAKGKRDFFMFGEILDHSDTKCGSYTGSRAGGAFALDSVLDYPLYFKINPVFARATGNTSQLAERFASISTNYDPVAQAQLVTFLDNHDQPRFLSSANAHGDIERLKLALVFLYTAQGIPCLYYGTEQAFDGGNDPFDREDMFAGQFEQGPSLGDNFNMTHPLFQWVARLNNFRRLYPALSIGSQSNLWSNADGPGLFAFSRRQGRQELMVVLNTASSSQTLPSLRTSHAAGTKLVNLFDVNDSITVDTARSTPPIAMGATSAKIFIEHRRAQALDPVVTGVSPAHDSANVSGTTPIVLRFSKAMKTASVESAFATLPPVRGDFSWSQGHDIVTFTPKPPGWQGAVVVRLSGAARDAVSGNSLYAPFETRFKNGN